MTRGLRDLEAWFVTGSQRLYGDDVLRRVDEHAARILDATPGEARVVGLTDLGDRFRLLVGEVELVAPDEPLRKLPVARAVWRPKPDLATAAEAWLMAGGPHHTALTSALGPEPLVDLADIANLELLEIDAATTATAFKRELRWNQAFYFVDRGV